LKLHLGCGENYLDGYVNIDFSIDEHTVQTKSVADKYEDITKLRFRNNSVDEVRLHHVFEHFQRWQAAAMLASWNNWLTRDGVVRIEVPDLSALSKVFLNPFSSLRAKAVAERHLFGSQEAIWAIHYEAYDLKLLKLLVSHFGFEIFKIKKTRWHGTYNLDISARKIKSFKSRDETLETAKKYLSNFLVDNTDGELRVLEIWLSKFELQLSQLLISN
jgi:predicted SAM-dependent methyltransferase